MASSNSTVTLTINAKDNASPAIKKVNMNLREMGEKIQNLGMMTTMAFTAPLVGGFALAVKSSVELQEALKPIQEAFGQIGKELGTALLPLVKEITPGLIQLSQSIVEIIRKFEDLPDGTKKAIVGVALFLGALGPGLMIIGNVIKFIGTLSMLFKMLPIAIAPATAGMTGFGTAAVTALGPIGALIIAVTTLLTLLNSDFGKSGIDAGKQLLALGRRAVTTAFKGEAAGNAAFQQSIIELGIGSRAGGGPVSSGRPYLVGERGPELFVPNRSGSISPNAGGTLIFNYSPGISTASEYEAQQQLKPMIEQILRQANGR